MPVEMLSRTAPQEMVGTWRRFGASGPVYEIVAAGQRLSGNDRLMRIRVLESGEELDYQLSKISEDPSEV